MIMAEYKLSYTGAEVNSKLSQIDNLAKKSDVPTKTSQLTNDSGFIAGYTETDPTVPSWAKASTKPTYAKSEIGLGNVDNVKQYSASNPPPYPVTKVNNKTGEVSLTASDVGADASGTASSAVSVHNTSTSAHSDIREQISEISSEKLSKSIIVQEAGQSESLVMSQKTVTEQFAQVSEAIADKVSTAPQTLTDEQKAQARENIGSVGFDPDCHAEYFQITDDGVVSLKPEYRGSTTKSTYTYSVSDMGAGITGSKNAELPSILYIPEIVDGIMTIALAEAMFSDNRAIKKVVLPNTVSEIPAWCFYQCYFLEEIYNTDNINTLGERCLCYAASLRRANFPNLNEAESASWALAGCPDLVYADVGNITAIPDRMFMYSIGLHRLRNSGKITSVGDAAFFKTPSLRHFDGWDGLTSIGKGAFIGNRTEYDWNSLTGCTFGANATPAQLNPTDFWSSCTYTPCENPLPTYFAQNNPAWANSTANSNAYSSSCLLFVSLIAYCGLNNITANISTLTELVNFVNGISTNILANNGQKLSHLRAMLSGLGLTINTYDPYTQENLQIMYDALANGNYVICRAGNGSGGVSGHAILAYGIKDNGEIQFVDTSSRYAYDYSKPFVYSCPYQNWLAPTLNDVYIFGVISRG